MFSVLVKQYINQNLSAHGMTHKTLSDLADVPPSTLHSYIQGKTSNPNIDALIRIAAVFGDGPEVIKAMRRDSLEAAAIEEIMRKKSDDNEIMEKHAELIRTNVSQILEEYRAQMDARQQEVVQQCRAHEQEYKQHCDALVAAEQRSHAALVAQLQSNIQYLHGLVRNVSILAALFGAYSLYAYKTFDIEDITRGLNRGGRTDLPFVLFVVILAYICISLLVGLVRRLRKSSFKE